LCYLEATTELGDEAIVAGVPATLLEVSIVVFTSGIFRDVGSRLGLEEAIQFYRERHNVDHIVVLGLQSVPASGNALCESYP
jgi:hypothetical protein